MVPFPLPRSNSSASWNSNSLAKKLGFSRIKPEGTQHIVMETPMEEPAWNLLKANLPDHLHSRFVYTPGKVTVRGLGWQKRGYNTGNFIIARMYAPF